MWQAQNCPRMTSRKPPFFDKPLEIIGQTQQAKAIRNVGTIAAEPGGERLLSQADSLYELLVCLRLLYRIQIFTLYIFRECDLKQVAVSNLFYDDRNGGESGSLRCPPTPFPSDQLIACAFPSNQNWLDYAVLPNRY